MHRLATIQFTSIMRHAPHQSRWQHITCIFKEGTHNLHTITDTTMTDDTASGAVMCHVHPPWKCFTQKWSADNPPCTLHPADKDFNLLCDCPTPSITVKVIQYGESYLVHGPSSCWRTKDYLGFWVRVASGKYCCHNDTDNDEGAKPSSICKCGDLLSVPWSPRACSGCERECGGNVVCDVCSSPQQCHMCKRPIYADDIDVAKPTLCDRCKFDSATITPCNVCNTEFTSAGAAEAHFHGKPHRKRKQQKEQAAATVCRACKNPTQSDTPLCERCEGNLLLMMTANDVRQADKKREDEQ